MRAALSLIVAVLVVSAILAADLHRWASERP
jgi:hypothetical protein